MTTPLIPSTYLTAFPDNETAKSTLKQLQGAEFTTVNHHVYSTIINGEKIFVKIYYNKQRSKELKRHLGLLEHEAFVEYHAFHKIEELGIPTITPITALSYKKGSFRESLIVTKDFHQDHQQFQSIKAAILEAPEKCESLLQQLSDLVLTLLKNNLFYLDVHLENFFTNGKELAIMDGEGTFHSPERKQNLSTKLLDMHARNLLEDLLTLEQDPAFLQNYFRPILKELDVDKKTVYQRLWKRQKNKRIDMYRRLLKRKASFKDVKRYHSPLPHLELFT